MANSCQGAPEEDSSFNRFSKTLLKSFVLVTAILCLVGLKKQYLTPQSTLFYYAMFIVLSTIIFGLVGMADSFVFNNIAMGMGIAIGMHIMDF